MMKSNPAAPPPPPRPRLIVDTREKRPLTFQHLEAVRGTLKTGDYSAEGLESVYCVERKSMADLAACCRAARRRFMEQMNRLAEYPFPRLLVVGTAVELARLAAVGRCNPAQVDHTLGAIQARLRVPVVTVATPEAAARLVEYWAVFCYREEARKAGRQAEIPAWCNGWSW